MTARLLALHKKSLGAVSHAWLACSFLLLGVGGNAYATRGLPPGSYQAVRYGLLWLDLDPGDAQVALDGEFLDRGVWLISMAPGPHDLSVRKEGFRPWTRRIGIGPGESLRLSVRLDPDPPK